MSRARGSGIAALLWTVAYAGLAMAAVSVRPDEASALSIVGAGLGLWALAWHLGGPGLAQRRHAAGLAIVAGVLAAFGLAELGGAVAAWLGSEAPAALWFGLAASFALVGVVGTAQAEPSDAAFCCQLLFHLLVGLLPALAMLPGLIGERVGLRASDVFQVVDIGLPLLVPSLLAAVLLDRIRGHGHGRAWPALLASQAAYALFAMRWAIKGF